MKITIGKTAGFCFGVKRAVDLAFKEGQDHPGDRIYSAGPLIHNGTVLADLKAGGVGLLEEGETPAAGSRVIIRAHGLPVQEIRRLEEAGCIMVDATCPKVARIHQIALEESAKNRHILIIGHPHHPEVKGIASRCGTHTIAETDEEIDNFIQNFNEVKISVVCQTTFSIKMYDEFVNKLKNTCNEVVFFDTICKATEFRQREAETRAPQIM